MSWSNNPNWWGPQLPMSKKVRRACLREDLIDLIRYGWYRRDDARRYATLAARATGAHYPERDRNEHVAEAARATEAAHDAWARALAISLELQRT